MQHWGHAVVDLERFEAARLRVRRRDGPRLRERRRHRASLPFNEK